MGNFEDRVALVTGGASGIGAAIAERLLEQGAKVLLLDVDKEKLEGVVATAPDRLAGAVADVTDDAAVEAATLQAVERFGRLDMAFAVAGAAKPGTLTDIAPADWTWTVDLVLIGGFLTVRHAARRMRESGRGGSIVIVSSLNAHVPMYGGSSYSAAKAGTENLARSAALELGGDGIRVNAVLPGLVDTPLTAGFLDVPPLREDYLARITLGRPATPSEIAGPCVYLASDDAAYVTGTSLVVDGGWENTNYADLRPYLPG